MFIKNNLILKLNHNFFFNLIKNKIYSQALAATSKEEPDECKQLVDETDKLDILTELGSYFIIIIKFD